jgi:hypothetical protein
MTADEQEGDIEQKDNIEGMRKKLSAILDGATESPDDEEIKEKKPVGLLDILIGMFGFVFAGAVCGVLLLFSCVMLFGYSAVPISNWMSAKSWESVECKITRSDFEMAYTYTYEGTSYTSDKYDFASDFVHLHDNENAQFPEGSTALCFVNPDRPSDAILSKAFNLSYFRGFVAVPPILFFLIVIYVYCVLPIVRTARWARGDNLE